MYQHRNDVYDDVHGEQFVFVGTVNGIAAATAKHGRIFFARSEKGQMVCLYADHYSAPVNLPDGFPLVLSADRFTIRDEVAIGTPIHAVCVPVQGKDPRAVRWCLQADFETCEQRIKQIQVGLEAERAWCEQVEQEAAELVRQAAERRRAELMTNPRDYDEAIALGWTIVPGLGNGSQRVLENETLFPGKAKQHRITRHLPPSTATKRTWLPVKRFAMA